MNKLITREEFVSILSLFLTWKSILFLSGVLSFLLVPLYSHDLLGGGYYSYIQHPYILPLANFDGEHYISIAIYGYRSLQYFFLPLYPLLISFFLKITIESAYQAALIGVLISNISFFVSLIFFYKLLRIDYEKLFSLLVIMALIFFPTSFYFQTVYTESLFFLLSVCSFYFARKGNFLAASLFAAFASGTRIIGVLLFVSLIIEAYLQKKTLKESFWILISPLGILVYMQYLFTVTGDFLAFYSSIGIFGEQRHKGVVLLPQIIYRYLKIMYTLKFKSVFFLTTVMEFVTGVGFFLLPFVGLLKKVRLSYLIYGLMGVLVSTLPGSFSSVPRYVIVLFPGFIVLCLLLNKVPKFVRLSLLALSLILLVVENALFIRGYWVS